MPQANDRCHRPVVQACDGPLIWYDAAISMPCRDCGGDKAHATGAVLQCAACGYIVTTGNWHDDAHTNTPIMREGYAYG